MGLRFPAAAEAEEGEVLRGVAYQRGAHLEGEAWSGGCKQAFPEASSQVGGAQRGRG